MVVGAIPFQLLFLDLRVEGRVPPLGGKSRLRLMLGLCVSASGFWFSRVVLLPLAALVSRPPPLFSSLVVTSRFRLTHHTLGQMLPRVNPLLRPVVGVVGRVVTINGNRLRLT